MNQPDTGPLRAGATPPTDRPRLLICDVDGTLLTSDKRLTPRAIQAAERLQAAGVGLVLTSGRPPRGMTMLVDPLHITTPLAAFNGGMVVAPDLSVLAERLVPERLVPSLVQVLAEHGLDTWLYSGADWFITDPDAPHVDREAATVRFPPQVTHSPERTHRVVKLVGVSDDPRAMAEAHTAVQEQFRGAVSAALSQPYYLDVTHPEANKGAVVDYMTAHLGVPSRVVAVMGDMPNDLLMFERAGLSIAPANAVPEVRDRADRVVTGNDEEGFATAVDRFLLND